MGDQAGAVVGRRPFGHGHAGGSRRARTLESSQRRAPNPRPARSGRHRCRPACAPAALPGGRRARLGTRPRGGRPACARVFVTRSRGSGVPGQRTPRGDSSTGSRNRFSRSSIVVDHGSHHRVVVVQVVCMSSRRNDFLCLCIYFPNEPIHARSFWSDLFFWL